MTTLLEKAKALPVRRTRNDKFNQEQFELLMGWAQGEVSQAQLCIVLKVEKGHRGTFYLWAAQQFRAAVLAGKLTNGKK